LQGRATDRRLSQTRHHRDDAQWPTGAAGDFHWQGNHVEPASGKAMEIRKIFEHKYVMGKERDMRFKLGRLAAVD
jgi:hypothetical protein